MSLAENRVKLSFLKGQKMSSWTHFQYGQCKDPSGLQSTQAEIKRKQGERDALAALMLEYEARKPITVLPYGVRRDTVDDLKARFDELSKSRRRK